ncbi:phospholipase D family protein [Tessaracoccus defluvii]
MLEPDNRSALTELLRPPRGWRLEHAVGTTFTLDLQAALRVPMSLAAQRDRVDDELGVLGSIARAADRIDVFAQAGALSFGHPRTDLVVFLEPMIHPVTTRPGGVFHPKVWFLEFARDDERCYRFLCASRNLTFDRSWDAAVRLDGTPSSHPDAPARNAPLTRLLLALPTLTVNPMPTGRRRSLEALAGRLAAVEWEHPDGVSDLGFEVWGLGEDPEPQLKGGRMLVVSPFVSEGGLRKLGALRRPSHLISRAETLDQLPSTALGPRLHLTSFDASTGLTEPDDDGTAGSHAGEQLTGLHAKLTVVEYWGSAYARIGSQNATDAGLTRNVEAMVTLRGRIDTLGIDATVSALGDLLIDHEQQPLPEPDPHAELDRMLDRALATVAATPVRIRTEPMAEGFRLLVGADPSVPGASPDVTLDWAPVTVEGQRRAWPPGPHSAPTVVEGLELAEVTPFLLVTARAEGRFRSTVLLARLENDPAGRQEAIVARKLGDPAAFQRFVALLLEFERLGEAAATTTGWGATGPGGSPLDATGLFEPLVQAVAGDHAGLADVDRLVRYLRDSKRDVLPEGFDALWAALWQAHRSLAKEAGR